MLATQAQQRNQRLDSQSVAILIGQPGVLVQMLVALIAIGGTALLLYFGVSLPLLMNGIMRAWRYAECLPGIALSVLLS